MFRPLLSLALIAALASACQPAAQTGSSGTTGGTTGSAPSVQTPRPSGAATPQGGAVPSGTRKTYTAAPAMAIDVNKTYVATFTTSKGQVVAELYPADSPNTVNNFVVLARDGYFDGLTFHRVEGWVVQGGDPTGTGRGGPGYQFADEPVKGEYKTGVVAMANAGPNTNGSQFFILKQDTPLPKAYNLFGKVTQGQDVVNRLAIGDKMDKVVITEK